MSWPDRIIVFILVVMAYLGLVGATKDTALSTSIFLFVLAVLWVLDCIVERLPRK